METTINRKALEWSCKEIMIRDAAKSKYLKENVDSKDRVAFVEWIGKLTYEQALMLYFDKKYIKVSEQHVNEPNIREKENIFKVIAKYGLASFAANAAWNSKKLVGNIASGAYASKLGLKVAAVHARRLATPGIIGALGMYMLYVYRAKHDVCNQQCKNKYGEDENERCQAQCRVNAANQVLNNIKSEIGKCGRTTNPEKCKKKLEKMAVKWGKILATNKARLGQL
jgi:hypothetical protein